MRGSTHFKISSGGGAIALPQEANLIRFYKFNETTGDAIDETGTQYGIVYGGMLRDGEKYTGNGSNAYVDAGFTSETNAYSIATRITTPSDLSGAHFICSKYLSSANRSIYLYLSNGTINWGINSSVGSGSYGPLATNTIYDLVFSVNSDGECRIFINKVLMSTDLGNEFTGTNAVLKILSYSSLYSKLTMDYFAFWNIGLTQVDVDNIPDGSL